MNRKTLKKIIICLIVVMVVVIIILSTRKKDERDVNELYNVLENNGYELYYNFNIYNYDINKNCYDENYVPTDCKRDFVYDSLLPTIYLTKNKSTILSFKYDDNKFIFKINDYYDYIYSNDSSKEYIVKSDNGEQCIHKIKGKYTGDLLECDGNKKEFTMIKTNFYNTLKNIGITADELLKVNNDLYYNYVVKHEQEIKNYKLSNQEVEKIINNNMYLMEHENALSLQDNLIYPNYLITITLENDKLKFLAFTDLTYEDYIYYITYDTNLEFVYNPNNECIYSFGDYLSEWHNNGNCTDSDIAAAIVVFYKYESILENLGITQEELDNFALYYFNEKK